MQFKFPEKSTKNFLSKDNFTGKDLQKTYSNFSDSADEIRKSLETRKISENVILKVTQLLENVGVPDFNTFELDEYIGRKTLFYITNAIFTDLEFENYYDQEKFKNFMHAITEGYNREVDYHNDLHAADVIQTSYVFMYKGNLKEKLKLHDFDILAALLAAACHDFKHPGFNNIFLVNTKSPLAIRYHGKSKKFYYRRITS